MSEINVAQPPASEGCETVSGMGHLLGYARISTTDQQPQLQVDALRHAGCYRVFTETASGARADRPTLAQVLDQLRSAERTTAGLAAARARGRQGGRPSVMTATGCGWPRRCMRLGSTPWQRSLRPSASAALRSTATLLAPTTRWTR